MGKLVNTMREDCGARRTLGARNSGFRGTRPDSLNSIQRTVCRQNFITTTPWLAGYGKKDNTELAQQLRTLLGDSLIRHNSTTGNRGFLKSQ
ncbi:hypothetical protein QLX08_003894 [Tetragonisca angustula]|uniref:Uncharacterized protein n=1 Tax=Tetragonisca angustula TaxID=166442 RepID=A0AAW1A6H0_9HYME